MPLVNPDTARRHCRVDSDEEADLIAIYLGAAEEAAMAYLNRSVYQNKQELDAAVAAGTAGGNPMVVNFAIQAAILLTLGHLFMNREDVIVGVSAIEMPRGSRDLLRPYRIIQGV
ncbi:head-tail connector protein [Chromobacterium haemolyticum]|uniref:head-tail connector protein n=1 Tax=Chromobacterium haemolyticum TaxID=394935 RepID=UPI004056C434